MCLLVNCRYCCTLICSHEAFFRHLLYFKNVATLEYNRYDEVVNMGYEHAMSALRARTIPQTRPLADAAGDGAVTIEEGEIQNQV